MNLQQTKRKIVITIEDTEIESEDGALAVSVATDNSVPFEHEGNKVINHSPAGYMYIMAMKGMEAASAVKRVATDDEAEKLLAKHAGFTKLAE